MEGQWLLAQVLAPGRRSSAPLDRQKGRVYEIDGGADGGIDEIEAPRLLTSFVSGLPLGIPPELEQLKRAGQGVVDAGGVHERRLIVARLIDLESKTMLSSPNSKRSIAAPKCPLDLTPPQFLYQCS